MKIKKVSGGYPIVAQTMLLLFFVPFTSLLSYIILSKNFTSEGCVFLAVFIVAIFFVLRFGFSYADIYLSEGSVVVKKLFIKRMVKMEEIIEINESFFPFTYYIRLVKSKVYFLPNATDLSRQLLSFNPTKGLELIREKFAKEG